MNGVIGMTSLLLESKVTEEQRDALHIVKNSAESLLTVVNDILDISKIESGKLELNYTPFRLRANLEAAVDVVSDSAAVKGLVLTSDTNVSAPIIVAADKTRIRQVTINLISNAIKFASHGEVSLNVNSVMISKEQVSKENEVHLNPLEGALDFGILDDDAEPVPLDLSKLRNANEWDTYELHFCIKDTGMGISELDIPLLFKSFSQIPGPSAHKLGGTGLGLAISRSLVEMMDGKIWCESSGLGHGSEFHFTIRVLGRSDVAVPQDLQQAGAVQYIKGHTSPLSTAHNEVIEPRFINAHVLVHHAHSAIRLQVSNMVTSWGFKVQNIEGLHAVLCQVAASTVLQAKNIEAAQKREHLAAVRTFVDTWMDENYLHLATDPETAHTFIDFIPDVLVLSDSATHHSKRVSIADIVHRLQEKVCRHFSLIAPEDQVPAFPVVMLCTMSPKDRLLMMNTILHNDSRILTPVKPSKLFKALQMSLTSPENPRALPSLYEGRSEDPSRSDRRSSSAPPIKIKNNNELASAYPLRILVAEDNLINQKVVTSMLKLLGYTPVVVLEGYGAVEAVTGIIFDHVDPLEALKQTDERGNRGFKVSNLHFDVVLMDLQMPRCGGIMAAKIIRAATNTVSTPYIIALTANVMDGDSQACLDAGMNDFVSKPMKLQTLISQLRTAYNVVNSTD
jgi:CheY-like chemotaxis protein/nitrogen-specific signal transduction histidine kinase